MTPSPQPQGKSLNVIALISGGKDSLYSLLHCIRNGHKVIALANLHPPVQDAQEDIDSFMYQTIGHAVIPLYEQALDIPLYRAPISGGAVDTARIYRNDAADQMAESRQEDEEDETESLVPLLKRVMESHPEANAVCAGAILSTYQRTRIENVAFRLGLTPLAWLWNYPVLPAPVEREGVVTQAGLLEDMAGVGCEARIIKVASGGLDEGFLWGNVSSADGLVRRRIERGMRRFVVDDLGGAVLGEGGGDLEVKTVVDSQPVWRLVEVAQSRNGGTWAISNLAAPEAGPGAGEQMDAIARKIQLILESTSNRTPADIVFATVLIRSMVDFPLMNDIYVSLFEKPNPPARATVACGDSLPEGVNIMVSLVVDLGPRDLRQGLHVQSRSYWAPANIGPYSQAMSIPVHSERLVYIAGQIPLEPASMDMVAGPESWLESYSLRAVLSLQHMWRIGAAMQVDWWLGAVAYLTGTDHIGTKAQIAWRLWEMMHAQQTDPDEDDEEPVLDAWDIKYGGRAYDQPINPEAAALPNISVVQSDVLVPPFFAVQVAELPRGSDIEWQGLGYRCGGLKMAADELDVGHKIDTITDGNLRYTGIEIDNGTELESCLQRLLERYSTAGVSHAVLYTAQPLSANTWPGQIVPCTVLVVHGVMAASQNHEERLTPSSNLIQSDSFISDSLRNSSRSPHPYHRKGTKRSEPHLLPTDGGGRPTSNSWPKTSSDSGTEADDESTGILKGLPAPPLRQRKGLRSGFNDAADRDSWLPLLQPWPSLGRSTSRSSRQSSSEDTGTGRVGLRGKAGKKRLEVLRRLLETGLLLSVGAVVLSQENTRLLAWAWRKDFLLTTSILPAELQLLTSALVNLFLFANAPQAEILKALLWLGGLCVFISCRHVLRWEVALARIPSWKFRRSPSGSQSRKNLLYVIDHKLCQKLSRTGSSEDALSDSEFEAHIAPIPRRTTHEFRDKTPVRELADKVPQENGHRHAAHRRRHTISSVDEVAHSERIRTTPSGRRKRSMAPGLASFLSLTVPQAQVRKWLYALYVYAAVAIIIIGPVRKYVGERALQGEEPFGWALSYLLGNVSWFRFWVIMWNLEYWIPLPPRLDGEICSLGWMECLRQTSFGEANTRLLIAAHCIVVIMMGLGVVFQLSSLVEVDTRRKVFHGMMVLMFLPTIYIDPAFCALALALVLSIFLLLDLFRASQMPPISRPLTYFLAPYVDGRDHRGPVIISHIFLLIGCSIPLWLSLADIPRSEDHPWGAWNVQFRDVGMVSGVVCVGLGDAAASLVGRRFGRRKWFWGGGKSLEGSVAFAAAVTGGLVFARLWLAAGQWAGHGNDGQNQAFLLWTWCKAIIAAAGTSATEAILTGCNDNVVVPIVLWLLVRGLGL
ncbi:ATP binding L-PSP endoribonuclease family protein [Aspergillus arachidicola]|uniref:Diphthine--ammonia ligase n=1 Tax=Aspergillus arachidicola TaxID=656916 RepID=A0A2G7GBX0_9EURO|nr:ATP binding L-PSP endoribonuclease family protein [Aspergillus arachidicola]